ncbi:hypothetical protein ACIBF5_22600 [Micromonospora sp. NPDC050417]|uniref:hypothetical protein n=1 Tax=Micromonospora sp. NPDC050417 TaxID=3364280 RepID=UPI0037AB27A7
MTELISLIGQRLTERWATVVLLPGLLYVLIGGCALTVGHAHALDALYLTKALNTSWQRIVGHAPAGPLLSLAALFGLAILSGVTATFLAGRVHSLWVMSGPQRWVERRQRKTMRAWASREPRPPTRYLPRRATSIGDTFRLVGERIHAHYGLSVLLAWPRIWILASPDTRTLVTTAYQRYHSDAVIAAWALLYLPLAAWWWPAALIATATAVIGYRRARGSASSLASLIEATADTHQHQLAAALGVPLPEGRITPVQGAHINKDINKQA